MLNEKIKKYVLVSLVMVVVAFILFNFRVFVIPTVVYIEGFEEKNRIVVEGKEYILKGSAVGSKNLYINGREILLNTDSVFSEKLYLSEYQNIFHIYSISKTGTKFEREIQIYRK